MVALGKYAFLTAISTIIISSSHCQNVRKIEEASVTRYRKFKTNCEENSTCENRWLAIRNMPRFSPILASILDQIIELYMSEKNILCILIHDTMKNDCFANAFDDFLKLGTRNVLTMSPGARDFDSRRIIYQQPTVYFLLGIDLSAVLKPLIDFGGIGGMWNPRGFYISIAESEEEAAEVMTNLWKNFVYKVIVLVFSNTTLDTIEAYTWRSYYPHGTCGPPTVKSLIRLGKFTKNLQYQKESDIEPGIIPKKFGNCPLNVSYNVWQPFVYPQTKDENLGLEVTLIEMVCEKMGVRVNPFYHALTVIKEPGEAWAGTRIPLASDIEKHDFSIPYIQDSFVWSVPCCDEGRVFKLNDGLSPSLWLPSILAMSITALSLMISGKKHWILWIWASFLEQSVYKVPTKIRGIWACWLLLCLHLSVAYKTALVSYLTNPVTAGEIRSQSELLKSGLKLGFLAEAEPWFDEEDEVDKKILERYVPCETVAKCYEEIPMGKAVFTNEMFADYLNGQRSETGLIAEKVRKLPTSLNYKIAMIYAKGHAMLQSFDEIVLLVLEAGLVEYWIQKIKERQTTIKIRRRNLVKDQQLSFSSISLGFEILITGLIGAAALFLYEKLNHLLEDKFTRYIKITKNFWNKKIKI